eukprot:GHRR01004966.1.p1 GENE.GHRR01004966.1~~GHRR01004966.1.p1  ORF type:complete len:429 (+),score=112.64 GHRR01004966.1:2349-3635(+)
MSLKRSIYAFTCIYYFLRTILGFSKQIPSLWCRSFLNSPYSVLPAKFCTVNVLASFGSALQRLGHSGPVLRSFCTMTLEQLSSHVVIIGSGPAAHTAAVYCARAELQPILFEGWLANGIAAGGQLTTTTDVENFPGFPDGIIGPELCNRFREQSARFGTRIFTETVNRVDLSKRPFKLWTDEKEVTAQTLIIATGAVAKRLPFRGSDEQHGFWNKGISACAVCDGAAPIFRNKPIAVIGGGDSAMEEAVFLTKYGSKVYIIHRRHQFRASKIMQQRALQHAKIKVLWNSVVTDAYGNERGLLGGVKIKNVETQEVNDLPLSGLFFAIGHEPATKFLDGQLKLDDAGYIITAPDSTATSVPGVYAAGDVQDSKWRQAITAAGSGCMAALEVEKFLEAQGEVEEADGQAAAIENGTATPAEQAKLEPALA